jgi:hypothetical protein
LDYLSIALNLGVSFRLVSTDSEHHHSPVPPFRFIPNLTKEDKKPERYFVQIQAKFLPEEGFFVFDSLLAEPTQKIPKYIKEIKPDEKNKMEQLIEPLDSAGNAG